MLPTALLAPLDATVRIHEVHFGERSIRSADIMRVVVSNKASVAGSIQEHRARTEPGAKGKFVARWSVLPDGSTEGATVESAEFRGTPLAECIEGLVRGWKFPRHRVAQQEPIRFPFTF